MALKSPTTVTRLLDSWRSTPRGVARSNSHASLTEQERQRARRRLSAMSTADLVEFFETNIAGIGTSVRNFRTTQDVSHLMEAALGVETQDVAIRELIRRALR